MKAFLIPLLIISTAALAVMTVRFAHRASAERLRAESAEAASRKHEARIHELELSRQTLEQQLMQAQRPAAPAAPIEAAPAKPRSETRAYRVASVSRTSEEPAATKDGAAPVVGRFNMNVSPGVERYMRRQHSAMLRKQFEDVGPALGLTDIETEKLLKVLEEQQARGYTPFWSQTEEMTLPEATRQRVEDTRKRAEAAISEVIGESRMGQWATYQQSWAQRMLVNSISLQLEQMGVPRLTYEQRQQLLPLLPNFRAQTGLSTSSVQGLTNEERMQQEMKRQDERNREMLERAKPVLTSEQYDAYRDYLEFQAQMSRNLAPTTVLQSTFSPEDPPPQQ